MRKVVCIADNILSPLGRTSEENYRAVLQGKSGVARHSGELVEDFYASLTDRKEMLRLAEKEGIDSSRFTYFELMCILSATEALKSCSRQGIPLNSCSLPSDRTQLILSTTKGNISLSLNASVSECTDASKVTVASQTDGVSSQGNNISPSSGDSGSPEYERLMLYSSARLINSHFGYALQPVVISNACISGVCAEIEALRRIRAGLCDYAVVIGCDEQSSFIVSGFQSFKALAPEPCRPFDADRKGLNLGEAAATVVLAAEDCLYSCGDGVTCDEVSRWEIVDGAIRNDANHISGPSRTGEGSYRALKYVLDSPLWHTAHQSETQSGTQTESDGKGEAQSYDDVHRQIAVVNAHGTATAYNDEMESIAIDRAGLSDVPVNSLKGFFGHTMGAAGILETIITMHATADGMLLPTKGYSICGVSHPLDISPETRTTDRRSFIKLISGFGGCNAAIGFRLNQHPHTPMQERGIAADDIKKYVADSLYQIEDKSAFAAHETDFAAIAEASVSADEDLAAAYHSIGCDYPKFFKMDSLCKTGFIASERLLHRFLPELSGNEDTAIVLMNRSASLCNDLHYCGTIRDKEHYFPSPALFVYTLPNIVTGEIAIRNKLYGESIFYIYDSPSDRLNDTQADELNDLPVKEVKSIKKIAEGHNDIASCIQNKILESVQIAFQDRATKNVIAGWVEASPEGRCEAKIFLFAKTVSSN